MNMNKPIKKNNKDINERTDERTQRTIKELVRCQI